MNTTNHNPRKRFGALGFRDVAVAALLGAVLVPGATPAQAAMSADEVKRQVESQLGVQVLRIAPVSDDGPGAFKVTVMNPGGDFNTAFQVQTVIIDAETGKPVRQFRHRASGYDTSGPFRRNPD